MSEDKIDDVKLVLIHDDGRKEVNIFVHGLYAVKTESELEELKYNILKSRPPGKVFLVFWQSGRFSPSVAGLAVSLFRVARYGSKAFNPGYLTLDVVFTAIKTLNDYKNMQIRADNLGQYLGDVLPDYLREFGDFTHVNLYGHSLGAKVIESAMLKTDLAEKVNVKNIIFMAACIDFNADRVRDMVNRLSKNFYNLYSNEDFALDVLPKFALEFEKKIGTVNIVGRNIYSENTKLGHQDYWKNLACHLENLVIFKPSRQIKRFSCFKCGATIVIHTIKRKKSTVKNCPHCSSLLKFDLAS